MITVDTAPGPAASAPAEQLTAIEELDYLLDRPAEPNLVLWEIHSHGHLDRAVLAAAVTAAVGADSGARRQLAAALISAPRAGSPAPEPASAPYGPPFTARDPAPGEGP